MCLGGTTDSIGQDPVAARSNLTNTPALYLLDPRGVIRYK
jgi:hypothetical protein